MSQWHGGKGDKDRTSDSNKYRNNYDLIDWNNGKEPNEPVKSEQESATKNQEVYYGS